MACRDRERGAAAVEFALVIPLLLALIVGILEVSHLYNSQILLTNAAREAARTLAISPHSQSAAVSAANSAYPAGIDPAGSSIPASCTEGSPVNVTVQANVKFLTGSWAGFTGGLTLQGKASMLCEK
ncbi:MULTISPECIES: TadE/TadG family type IV pilus assembly protein [Arthrobacter]|uniref:TadE/TadG family type IV pilus assembly protein n=2 Tax=Arthrobacter TaxID=1663 RepID=A0ABU9KJK6_9MICC|nr:TadE/TadG family type IV pilus assembly protein [Arthrobacter sp. YJM1]MDP5225763.1 pilus assembly protein [Arthrobacter sp. YJM1]